MKPNTTFLFKKKRAIALSENLEGAYDHVFRRFSVTYNVKESH